MNQSSEKTVFSITYSGKALKGIDGLTEIYTITGDGVRVEAILHNPSVEQTYFLTPAFMTNGRDESIIRCEGSRLEVTAMGWKYIVETDGIFKETNDILGNRNGKYRKYIAVGNSGSIKMKFKMEKAPQS